MATPSRRKTTSVIASLTQQPYRFNFFQAVRLLEQAAGRRQPGDQPARSPVGHDQSPAEEVVRFRALPSHTFPSSEIAHFAEPVETDSDRPPEMTVSFLGLIGPAGVLPQHYTQLVIDRIRRKDHSLRDYLDLFHHRLISLFYRAWRKYHFYVQYERAAELGVEDLFTQTLYCLVGWGTPRLRGRQEILDEAWLYYAGHFARYPRNAYALEQIVADFFHVSVEIVQFVGQWLYLDRGDQSTTPRAGQYAGCHNTLGLDVVIGERVWGVENKFRLRLGPLTYTRFRQFSPLGELLVPLCQLARSYVGPDYDFDVQPVLLAEEVPPCQLAGGGGDGAYLGWNTWLLSQPLTHNAADAIFTHEGAPSRNG